MKSLFNQMSQSMKTPTGAVTTPHQVADTSQGILDRFFGAKPAAQPAAAQSAAQTTSPVLQAMQSSNPYANQNANAQPAAQQAMQWVFTGSNPEHRSNPTFDANGNQLGWTQQPVGSSYPAMSGAALNASNSGDAPIPQAPHRPQPQQQIAPTQVTHPAYAASTFTNPLLQYMTGAEG